MTSTPFAGPAIQSRAHDVLSRDATPNAATPANSRGAPTAFDVVLRDAAPSPAPSAPKRDLPRASTADDDKNTPEAPSTPWLSANESVVARSERMRKDDTVSSDGEEGPKSKKASARRASADAMDLLLGRGKTSMTDALKTAADDAGEPLLDPSRERTRDHDLARSESSSDKTTKAAQQAIVDDGALATKGARLDVSDMTPVANTTEAAPAPTPDVSAATVRTPSIAETAPPTATAFAAAVPARAMDAIQQALRQEGVSVRVLDDGARLTLQLQDGSELAVRLVMRDGAVEVRAAGLASQLLEGRAPELRAALAQEGLSLGKFSSGADPREGKGQSSHDPSTDEDAPVSAQHASARVSARSVDSGRSARRLHTGTSIVA